MSPKCQDYSCPVTQWVLMLQSQRYLLWGSGEQLTAIWPKERWFMLYHVRKLIWVSEVQQPCSYNRLTSDFRNKTTRSGVLLKLCLSGSLAIKSISSSEFMKDQLQRAILKSKEQYFVLQHHVIFGSKVMWKRFSVLSHAKWSIPLHTNIFFNHSWH